MSSISTHWAAFLAIAIGSVYTLSADCTQAQITPDATLPNNSIININGNTLNITGGTQAGGNLFHSFQQFSVPTGGEAFFNNTVDIQNIISRVTGGSISNIDGLIRTLGTANLFLINPNGIVFGPNASLNIGGSFIASTASSLKFADGTEFRTDGTQTTPLLTISVPLGLQFGAKPGSIQYQSPSLSATNGLIVPPRKSLALLGGDVAIEAGYLQASGGRVELGGLAEPGTVALQVNGNNLSLGFPDNVTRADVSLTNEAIVSVQAADGGSIAVNARNLNILGGSSLSAGIVQSSDLVGTVAGDITLNATGEIKIGQGSEVFNVVQPQAQGNGGNLTINAQQLLVQDGAQVRTTTFGAGKGGNLTVSATEKVEISGFGTSGNGEASASGLFTGATATGDAGNLKIDTKELIVRDGALGATLTQGAGKGGNLTVNATEKVEISGFGTSANGQASNSALGTGALATGNAGDLKIDTKEFILRDGAGVTTLTQAAGKGGNLTVNATEKVEISGFFTSANGQAAFNSVLSTGATATGNAGDLKIDTKEFILRDGAGVSTSTSGAGKGGNLTVNATEKVEISGFFRSANDQAFGSILTTGTSATGDAGDLKIDTKEFIVRNGAGVNTITQSEGKGGNLTVNATEKVEISGFFTSANGEASSSGLVTGALATGDAGNLKIDTKAFIVRNGAGVTTITQSEGKGGNLSVNATEKVEISGFFTTANGQASPSVLVTGAAAIGDAGELKIDTKEFIVQDGAGVSTGTTGAGKGGNLTVNASEKVEIRGFGTSANGQASPSLLATGAFASGTAGSLKIDTQQLIVRDRAGVFVGRGGTGAAGNLEINARSIRLDNEGVLSAESTSGNGGNINLQVADLLLLRRRSQISASAGTAQQGGDGGNITINAPNGFIVGVRNENSDITANAFNGTGGKININSLGIFNFTQRSREDLVRELGTDNPNQLNSRDLQTNDITAISLSNQNLSGEVSINTPDADQSLGLVELPIVLADTSKLIANAGCDAIASTDADTDKSKFTITGRGGLPPSPYEPLSTDVIWLDTRTSATTTQQQRSEGSAAKPPSKSNAVEIVPATGWVFDGKGNVTLISNASKANSLGTTPAGCPQK